MAARKRKNVSALYLSPTALRLKEECEEGQFSKRINKSVERYDFLITTQFTALTMKEIALFKEVFQPGHFKSDIFSVTIRHLPNLFKELAQEKQLQTEEVYYHLEQKIEKLSMLERIALVERCGY